MNIRPNLHNVAMIVAIAVLGLLALKMAAKTQASNLPVVGQILRVGSSA